jgi:hypothetical protein
MAKIGWSEEGLKRFNVLTDFSQVKLDYILRFEFLISSI